jgi:hypothetical protein
MILKREIGFFALIVSFGLAVSLLAISLGHSDTLTLSLRLFALNGYISLSVAVIMTPFLKEITLFFKKSFTKVHHYFAVAGILLISLHPIAVFIQALSLAVFLPNFMSLYLFFFYGGFVAIILIYLAFGAALLRRKIVTFWRPFHMFIYLALFVGVVHANLRGTDFSNLYIKIIFDALFAGAVISFCLKRFQFYRLKIRTNKNRLGSQTINKA